MNILGWFAVLMVALFAPITLIQYGVIGYAVYKILFD